MLENLRKEFPWPPAPQQVAVWILLAVGLVATIVKMGAAPSPSPVVVGPPVICPRSRVSPPPI